MRSYHVLFWVALVTLAPKSVCAQPNSRQLDILGPTVPREEAPAETVLPPDVLRASDPRAITPRRSSGNDFADRLWNYLQNGPVAYNEWRAFPGRPESLQPGHSPHGSSVRLVANRKARSSSSSPIHGSMLILENFNSTGGRLTSITLMYRSSGYNREHNDWFWAKYRPDGTLAKVNGRPGAGRMSSCIQCHQKAGGGDYVFSND